MKIGISGSYGGMNLGDEAILDGILNRLRATLNPEIVVFSFNAKDTEKRHHVRAIPIREMQKDPIIEELKTLDLLILGGGGILFDGVVDSYLRDVAWAQELGIPVMVYAISVGPLRSAESKQRVVEVLNKVDLITVRESESKRTLHDLGIQQPIEVTADPALLIESAPFTEEMLQNEGIQTDKHLVGFSVREPGPAAPDLNIDHYHNILANAADFMIERFDAQVVFVPMEPEFDQNHAHAVISKISNVKRASVLKGEYTSQEILGLVQHMAFAVGMRLHFLIFAGLQHIPFVPLPYASKVKGFIDDLELPSHSFDELNPGKLCASLDRAWDNRKHVEKLLSMRMPLLQEKARQTHELLMKFIGSKWPS